MSGTKKLFDEIRVYDGAAERTGVQVDRSSIRGRQGVCRSLTALTREFRRLGDGYYYLAPAIWPEGASRLVLQEAWTPRA